MENKLADHIRKLDMMFYGLTRSEIMKIAFEYAKINNLHTRFSDKKAAAGKTWLYSFCKRHDLSFWTPTQCSVARAMGFNEVSVYRFFENLRQCYELYEFKIPAHRIYNANESGISTMPNRKPKVSKIFQKIFEVVSLQYF